MALPPCIRNLSKFKKGCPEKSWDGKEGCTCWIEMTIPNEENPLKRDIGKHCIDMWMFILKRASLSLLEGNQIAIESFRNGMIFQTENGKSFPRANPASIELLKIFEQMKNQVVIPNDANDKKLIDD